VFDHAALFLGKALVLLYRLALVLLAAGLALALWRRLSPAERAALVALLGFALLRKAVLSYQTSIDNRYMIPAIATAELLLPLLLWWRLSASP